MKHLNVLAISATVALLAMTATASATSTSWTTALAGFWSDGQISDSEFLDAIQFLVDEDIIHVNPQIVEVEVIKEVQAQTMPTDNGALWESIGALQEEDESEQKHTTNMVT